MSEQKEKTKLTPEEVITQTESIASRAYNELKFHLSMVPKQGLLNLLLFLHEKTPDLKTLHPRERETLEIMVVLRQLRDRIRRAEQEKLPKPGAGKELKEEK